MHHQRVQHTGISGDSDPRGANGHAGAPLGKGYCKHLDGARRARHMRLRLLEPRLERRAEPIRDGGNGDDCLRDGCNGYSDRASVAAAVTTNDYRRLAAVAVTRYNHRQSCIALRSERGPTWGAPGRYYKYIYINIL